MSAVALAAAPLFSSLGGGAALGAGAAAGAGGLFAGGGMGVIGTVLGGISSGLMARAEHRAEMERDEAETERRRANYRGSADGIAAGQSQSEAGLDGPTQVGTGFAQVMQRVDPNSNANLRVGQREQPPQGGFAGMMQAQPAGGGAAPADPTTRPAVGRRAQYDARSGRIQYV